MRTALEIKLKKARTLRRVANDLRSQKEVDKKNFALAEIAIGVAVILEDGIYE